MRDLYRRALALGSVPALKAELDRAGITVPRLTDGRGRPSGGMPFGRGHLYALLANPVYVGRLTHKDRVHEGQRPAIVDEATWDAVQAQLRANTRTRSGYRLAATHLLAGLIRCGQEHLLSPTHTAKGPVRYRYYVRPRTELLPALRVAAGPIEAEVVAALRSAYPKQAEADAELVARHLTVVAVHPDRLELRLADDTILAHPWSPPSTRRRRDLAGPPPPAGDAPRPMKTEDRARILTAIATGRRWMEELAAGTMTDIAALASRAILSERAVRMTLALAHLSPAVVTAIVAGQLPREVAIRDLAALPASWAEQEQALGLRA